MAEKSKPAKAPAKTVKIAKPSAGNQAVVTRKTKAAPDADGAVLPRSERARLVAEAAYYLAEGRGFAPGNEHDDWLEAERHIDRRYRFT